MAATTANWQPTVPSLDVLHLDPASRVTHGCQTIFLLIFTILWNSVAWPMSLVLGASDWADFGVWLFRLFRLPFLGIGLWMIWLTIRSFITHWYPVPR